MSAVPPVPPFGSEVIMMPISSAFWGATCVQTFIYFLYFSHKDTWATKLLVIWLWLADTVHIFLSLIGVYRLSVLHWGDEQYLEGISQPFLWSLMFTSLVACSVQLFFTRRLWIMRTGNPVCYILPLLAIAQPAIYLAFLIIAYTGLANKSVLFAELNLLIAEWAISAATDVLISVSLLYMIWKLRNSTEILILQSTNKILERVAVLTINTGVWTAICSLFSIIVATVFSTSPAFTAVAFLICPLYCNTLLANLNMRDSVRGNNFSVVSRMTFAHGTVDAASATQIAYGETEAASNSDKAGKFLSPEKTV